MGKNEKRVPSRTQTETCSYCVQETQNPEKEHVFPESWYRPGVTRDKMMIVPACAKCNRFFGRFDNDARVLALGGSGGPLTEPLVQRVWRSMDPSLAKDLKDKRARRARAEKMKAALGAFDSSESAKMLWTPEPQGGFVEHQSDSGVITRGTPGLRISPGLIITSIGKWIRGSYRYLTRRPLPPYAPWKWHGASASDKPEDFIRTFAQTVPLVFDRDEFRVYGAANDGAVADSLWMFLLWDYYVFWGATGSLTARLVPGARAESLTRGVVSGGTPGSHE